MSAKVQSLLLTGDISLGQPDSERYFSGVSRLLAEADVRIGQLESPHIEHPETPAQSSRPTAILSPLAGRFDLITLAGNHLYDFGEVGISDTISWLEKYGISHAGGGNCLQSALTPAFVSKGDIKYGVLAYNAVGPKGAFAREDRGGCAPIGFTRAQIPISEDTSLHENDIYDFKKPISASGEVILRNFPDSGSLMRMAAEIAALRCKCDVLCVYFHKGMVHRPAAVADDERLMCHIAIDAGADVIFSSHAHLLRGVEFYKDRPIFHGLGNFVACVPTGPTQYSAKDGSFVSGGPDWFERRRERFGFLPDPERPTYPFHPEAIYTAAAKLSITVDSISCIHIVPLFVGKDGITRTGERGAEVMDYLTRITDIAQLNARYTWDGDEILVVQK